MESGRLQEKQTLLAHRVVRVIASLTKMTVEL